MRVTMTSPDTTTAATEPSETIGASSSTDALLTLDGVSKI